MFNLSSERVILTLLISFVSALSLVNAIDHGSELKHKAGEEGEILLENNEDLFTDDQDAGDNKAEEKVTWINHDNDHSLYSGRSLMSIDNLAASTSDLDEDEKNFLKSQNFAEKEWQLMFRSFDLMYDGMSTSILQELVKKTNLFDDVVSRLKPECKRDIYHTRNSVKKHKIWALRMLDSIGKIPSGITYGKFSSPGDYEECLSVNVDEIIHNQASLEGKGKPERYKFHGKYCLLDFRLPMPEKPKGKLLSIHEPVIDLSNTDLGRKFPEIKNYSGYAAVLYDVGYMHGFCLPSSCDVTDLYKSIGASLEGLHVIVNNTIDCQEKYPDNTITMRKSQVISLVLLVMLFLNASVATFMHHLRASYKNVQKKSDDSEHLQSKSATNFKQWVYRKAAESQFYSECFSIQSNLSRLTKPDPRGLTFVHYTRIVAMALTVITHTGAMGTLQAITKPADASNSEQIFRDLLPQMLANAFTSIQVFFFMAGFMLVISTYPSLNRDKGHVSFLEYAIKRAIRLMPGIAATICLNFLWPLIIDGPMLSYFIRLIVIPCESTWWRTLTFLSNFDHVEKMCLRHSYFSASDYQLHIMAFPLLILLYKQPILSLSIAGTLTIAGFVAQVIMILTKTVLPFMMVDYVDKEAFFNVVHYIHHPVWNHMSAFFYGFILGYLVVKQVRINLSPKAIKCTWLLLTPAGIGSIFAPYFWNHYKRPIYKWQMVLYVLFDRFALLTFCAWLSYATMVLSRPPKKRSDEKEAKINNVPHIVLLNNDKTGSNETIAKDQADGESRKQDDAGILLNPTASLPRQRSTPNLLLSQEQPKEAAPNKVTPIRSAVSSGNVPATEGGTPASTVSNTIQTEPPKTRSNHATISNVNTLCLVLSRLTFQLYLFNMVVLWVDVNHSKYYWFFSYYFIITKALAVYICSALFAMVFFITLESPCLTLYIWWVKSRAQKRANRRTEHEVVAYQPDQQDKIELSARESPKSTKDSDSGNNFGGLVIRFGPPEKPTYSFIDLSRQPAKEEQDRDDQTKM